MALVDLVKRFGLPDGAFVLSLAPVWMIAMMAAAEEDPCRWLRAIMVPWWRSPRRSGSGSGDEIQAKLASGADPGGDCPSRWCPHASCDMELAPGGADGKVKLRDLARLALAQVVVDLARLLLSVVDLVEAAGAIWSRRQSGAAP